MCFDFSMGGPAPSKPLRAFLALRLPEEQRRQLAAHVEECARRAPGYRWVPAENLHLTLRFLGPVEPDPFAAESPFQRDVWPF